MNDILIDTSVIIDHLRVPDKSSSLLYKLAKKRAPLFISIITHTELYSGKSVWEHKNGQKELEMLLSGLTILSLTQSISERAGKIRAQQGIHLFDAIIAGTALENKLILATLNVKDFKKISKLKLYK